MSRPSNIGLGGDPPLLPVWQLAQSRGQTELAFTAPDGLETGDLDAVFIAAEHGQGVAL